MIFKKFFKKKFSINFLKNLYLNLFKSMNKIVCYCKEKTVVNDIYYTLNNFFSQHKDVELQSYLETQLNYEWVFVVKDPLTLAQRYQLQAITRTYGGKFLNVQVK